MTGSERRGGSAGELAVLGLLTALLFGGKLALAWLPNVEPVSLLVIVYTAVLGWRALLPLYAYVLLEVVTWGLNLWSVCYVYVWLILAGAAWLLRRMESMWLPSAISQRSSSVMISSCMRLVSSFSSMLL